MAIKARLFIGFLTLFVGLLVTRGALADSAPDGGFREILMKGQTFVEIGRGCDVSTVIRAYTAEFARRNNGEKLTWQQIHAANTGNTIPVCITSKGYKFRGRSEGVWEGCPVDKRGIVLIAEGAIRIPGTRVETGEEKLTRLGAQDACIQERFAACTTYTNQSECQGKAMAECITPSLLQLKQSVAASTIAVAATSSDSTIQGAGSVPPPSQAGSDPPPTSGSEPSGPVDPPGAIESSVAGRVRDFLALAFFLGFIALAIVIVRQRRAFANAPPLVQTVLQDTPETLQRMQGIEHELGAARGVLEAWIKESKLPAALPTTLSLGEAVEQVLKHADAKLDGAALMVRNTLKDRDDLREEMVEVRGALQAWAGVSSIPFVSTPRFAEGVHTLLGRASAKFQQYRDELFDTAARKQTAEDMCEKTFAVIDAWAEDQGIRLGEQTELDAEVAQLLAAIDQEMDIGWAQLALALRDEIQKVSELRTPGNRRKVVRCNKTNTPWIGVRPPIEDIFGEGARRMMTEGDHRLTKSHFGMRVVDFNQALS